MIQADKFQDLSLEDEFVSNGVAMDDDLLIMNYFDSSTSHNYGHDSLETLSSNFPPSAMSYDFY